MSLTVEYDTIKPQQLRNIDNTDTGAKIGSSYKVSGSTYKVTASGTVALVKAKNAKSVSVPASVKIKGKTFKVTQINARAFKGKQIRAGRKVSVR